MRLAFIHLTTRLLTQELFINWHHQIKIQNFFFSLPLRKATTKKKAQDNVRVTKQVRLR